MKNSWGFIVVVIIISLLSGVLGGYLIVDYTLSQHLKDYGTIQQQPTNNSSISQSQATTTLSLSSFLPQLVEEIRTSVVHIEVISYVEQFNIFGGYSIVPQEGLGSGFFINYNNHYYIVTNRHVVKGADKVTVKLYDGTSYRAQVLGTDDWSDIAVLKLIDFPDDKEIRYLSWGDSSEVKVGDFVIAVGNPYGFDYTVTFGIISAKERTINEGNGVVIFDALQTDAAINPGNSGGPLITMDGKVVGINTAIYAQGQGIGFAVSSNTAKRVVMDILEYGYAKWPYLGIYMADINRDMKEKLDLPFDKGVYVVRVILGGPADQAGLRKGDIIVALNDISIDNSDELARIIRQKFMPGDKITLKIYRNGEYIDKVVTLGEKPHKIND